MTLASLRERAAVLLKWITAQIAVRPRAALIAVLVVWIVSLAFAAWMF